MIKKELKSGTQRNSIEIPTTPTESDDFRETLEAYSSLIEDDDFGMNNPAWTVNHGPIETRRRPPEEHLRMVQERFSHPEVAKTTLRDE